MTTRNRWHSPEGTDPLATWTFAAPAPTDAERRAIVGEVLDAGRASGVLLAGEGAVAPSGEPLPWEAAAYAGPLAPFASRVVVRDAAGALVTRTAGDAGALLRALEPLDDAYARRFAASRPFATAWSSSTSSGVTVTIAFGTSLWASHGDDALEQANAPALAAFRASLTSLARRRGARLTTPRP
jgi:hypothetical protein